MGFLERAALVTAAIASCYSPDARDCTVSCERVRDCLSGQVCGTDHLCASPAVAGRCASSPPPAAIDAGDDTVRTDAHVRDAPAPPPPPPDTRPDPPATVALEIVIMGAGTVELDGVGSCDKDCTLLAPLAELATLRALPNPKQVFDQWTQGPCIGQGATCMFVALVPVTIAVRFVKAD